jgi:hypothetical protein
MKNKILVSLIILFLYSFPAIAQTTPPATAEMGKASFGIYAGVNFQNINGTAVNGDKLKNSLLTKFMVGLSYQLPVAPDFYLALGLQYSGKGAKGDVPYTIDNTTYTEKRQIDLNYIEIPINFLYKPLVGKGHFMLGFGPYVGYAISGKTKFTGDVYTATPSVVFENSITLANPNDLVYFRHLDVGANGFFGFEFANNLNIVFNAQLGLVNINSSNSGIANSKLSEMNTGFGLSLGYRF